IRLDAEAGVLELKVDAAELARRTVEHPDLDGNGWGVGRELFANARAMASGAEQGAISFSAAMGVAF
ncbi:MAG: phosphogluconate dehydratase, partial [Solimonas sp.]